MAMDALRFRRGYRFGLLIALLCCGGCSKTGGYNVEFQFESSELRGQADWAHVELSDGCDSLDDPGTGEVVRDFSNQLPLGSQSGPQYIRGWAYDASCRLIATGCTAFDAVSGANVTIVLTFIADSGPANCSQCDPEVCDDSDAGPNETCSPFEIACDDFEDGDCDGLTDCEDPDCSGQTCSDDNGCTVDDTCVDFACKGTGMECDDGNPCTDNTCIDDKCTFVDNSAACDDGFWCNGSDTCSEGSCSLHSEAPCTEFCSETKQTCDQCAGDTDCGLPEVGEWSDCQFADTCTMTGTSTRTVRTPRCDEGTCTLEMREETQSCTRPTSTEGQSCGSVRYGNWSSCSYSNACSESGTRTRDVFTPKCGGGTCSEVKTSQSGSCSRTVDNGTSCGGTWSRCCDGTCRDLRTNSFCGACNISCSSQGRSCVSSGTGGYQCTCANSDAQCRSIYKYNNIATCYQNRCNCQCSLSGGGVCQNGGCGSNFYCHDCDGQNFCAPFGGSC